ncbi:alanine racemase [Bacillus sp. 31A1R]|uniref:Alanine racemase n=1 Tax=Robertmurraya mangrovi TaxID=3098077 RepID=A0ABU5J595_9BACI|nr:alanine racemase [Bacillus sp. 31A1R]MDZ5474582.1 alanine racemase [Bacillus sp. 31A1R]
MEDQSLFYRDTWAEVDLDCIMENVRNMKKHLPEEVELMAVVKANAYGHGDEQVAQVALEGGATYLAVAFLDEAISLRRKGIQAPILVLGASRPEDINVAVKYNLTLTVFQKDWLNQARKILTNKAPIKIHLKLDTGMGRLGIREQSEIVDIEQILQVEKRFYLEGAFTHFATSDELNESYFKEQLERFETMLSWFNIKPKLIHASNSAAALRMPNAHFNGIRYGIGMYGLTPSLEIQDILPFPLKEAFSLHSKLVHVKKVTKGEKISYGATYESNEDEWIGTLPIGYADGWIRKLQGQKVIINGIKVPIVGRICMDQCMIKLPYELPVGTEVTLIGTQGNEHISINDVAEKLETINYEVPCLISSRVPRMYKKSGKLVQVKNSMLV